MDAEFRDKTSRHLASPVGHSTYIRTECPTVNGTQAAQLPRRAMTAAVQYDTAWKAQSLRRSFKSANIGPGDQQVSNLIKRAQRISDVLDDEGKLKLFFPQDETNNVMRIKSSDDKGAFAIGELHILWKSTLSHTSVGREEAARRPFV